MVEHCLGFRSKRFAPGSNQTIATEEATATGRGLVVLVEDDVGMREAVQRVLAATGFVVTDFASSEAALQDCVTLDAHCLVLDIHLAGLSGFEMYERLVALGRKPAVIFITGRDEAINQT